MELNTEQLRQEVVGGMDAISDLPWLVRRNITPERMRLIHAMRAMFQADDGSILGKLNTFVEREPIARSTQTMGATSPIDTTEPTETTDSVTFDEQMVPYSYWRMRGDTDAGRIYCYLGTFQRLEDAKTEGDWLEVTLAVVIKPHSYIGGDRVSCSLNTFRANFEHVPAYPERVK